MLRKNAQNAASLITKGKAANIMFSQCERIFISVLDVPLVKGVPRPFYFGGGGVVLDVLIDFEDKKC